MKQVFLIILISLLQNTTLALHTINSQGNETDHTALLAIKTQLIDQPNGVLTSWNHSIHHCKWYGITCGPKHNRVTILDLNSRALTGTISLFIGNLSFLRFIYLFNNTIHGEIPETISRCIHLRTISLSYNHLEGKLPVGIRLLSKLEYLKIPQNNLTGSLFDVIQNLTSLVNITVAYNSFTGNIPSSIGRIKYLKSFQAADNQLSGEFPASLVNISSLEYIMIAKNRLNGSLPEGLRFTVPNLKWLYVAANNLSGKIPNSIRNLTSLESIGLQENGFTRRIPRGFGRFPNLNQLSLYENYLVGDISFISTLVNCSRLKLLAVDRNEFSGVLPESVANLSTGLNWLNIGDGLITGKFPAGITNLVNLQYLSIIKSGLTGSIPRDFGKLDKLGQVDFSSNRLTGRIPDSVGNLSRLRLFSLNDNLLEGSIPANIGNCESLQWLDFINNRLSGKIPGELFSGSAKFIGLYLSRNHLEGSLPFEIGKQNNLVDFHVFDNKLTGEIPESLSDCVTLQYLDMKGNSFHGNISSSFGSLTSLVQIDVSRNHLSCQIPVYLSKFPLTYLNLSYNDFEGNVPTVGVFTNVSAVFLVGNKRLCGGIQELHLPKCVDEHKSSTHKKAVIISTVCAVILVLFVLLASYLIYRRKKRQPISSTPIITGESFMKVSYDMLLKAVSGFSSDSLIGEGSFGSVYKGVLEGKIVAVKILNMEHRGASKSFIAECEALRNVCHRNLVGIITACSSIDFRGNEFRALVYEFMPNESLDRWLHGGVGNMSVGQRVDVAIDVAHAINYLHYACEIPIVHCDLKPSNVLLDNDMVARVGDFGLSKFLVQPRLDQSSMSGIRDTFGYAAPEYGLGSEASTDGDVYSCGILLLELITGKTPTDDMFKEDYNLRTYAEEALPDQVLQIIDPSLNEEPDYRWKIQDARIQQKLECIVAVISVGVLCSNHLPQSRMKITEAIGRLQSARDNLLHAKK